MQAFLRAFLAAVLGLAAAVATAQTRGQQEAYSALRAALQTLQADGERLAAKEKEYGELKASPDGKLFESNDRSAFLGPRAVAYFAKIDALEAELSKLRQARAADEKKRDAAFADFKAATADRDGLVRDALKARSDVVTAGKVASTDPDKVCRALRTIDVGLRQLAGPDAVAYVELMDSLQAGIHAFRPWEDINKDLEKLAQGNKLLQGLVANMNDMLKDKLALGLPRALVDMSQNERAIALANRFDQVNRWLGHGEKGLGLLRSLVGQPADPLGNRPTEVLTSGLDFLKEVMPDALQADKMYITMQLALLDGIYDGIKRLNAAVGRQNLLYIVEYVREPGQSGPARLSVGAPFGKLEPGGTCWDLNGTWQGNFGVGGGAQKAERVQIVQVGRSVVVTKITGDDFVPAGQVTIHATYDANPFAGEQVCAARGFVNPQWTAAKITIVDKDHFQFTSGCAGSGATFERVSAP